MRAEVVTNHGEASQRSLPRALWTIEETATYLKVRPGTIRSWLLKGRLPKIKVGCLVRIPEEAVARLVAEGTTLDK
jgi:excisionase family DNA binding protein